MLLLVLCLLYAARVATVTAVVAVIMVAAKATPVVKALTDSISSKTYFNILK